MHVHTVDDIVKTYLINLIQKKFFIVCLCAIIVVNLHQVVSILILVGLTLLTMKH